MKSPSKQGTVRRMDPGDVENVSVREARVFETAAWDEAMLHKELDKHSRSRWFVFERAGTVRGHAGCWIMPDRLHITTIAVDPEVRREGIARRLMESIHESLDHERPFRLEVRSTNQPARKLYEGLGYRVVGKKPAYYKNDGEDAVVMEYREVRK